MPAMGMLREADAETGDAVAMGHLLCSGAVRRSFQTRDAGRLDSAAHSKNAGIVFRQFTDFGWRPAMLGAARWRLLRSSPRKPARCRARRNRSTRAAPGARTQTRH